MPAVVGQKRVKITVDAQPSADVLTYVSEYTDINGQVRALYYGGAEGEKIFRAEVLDDSVVLASTATVTFYSSFASIDTTTPTVTSFTPSVGAVVKTQLTEVRATLSDTGGSGVNLSSSTLSLTRPSGAAVSGTKSTSGTDTIILTFSAESTNGIYTISVTAFDNANNYATFTSTFTIYIVDEEQAFKDSVKTYPNPSDTGSVIIGYSLEGGIISFTPNPVSSKAGYFSSSAGINKVTLKIFNLLGELVREDELDATPGENKTFSWRCDNQNGSKVGTGVYILKLIADTGSKKYVATKKQIVIRR